LALNEANEANIHVIV